MKAYFTENLQCDWANLYPNLVGENPKLNAIDRFGVPNGGKLWITKSLLQASILLRAYNNHKIANINNLTGSANYHAGLTTFRIKESKTFEFQNIGVPPAKIVIYECVPRRDIPHIIFELVSNNKTTHTTDGPDSVFSLLCMFTNEMYSTTSSGCVNWQIADPVTQWNSDPSTGYAFGRHIQLHYTPFMSTFFTRWFKIYKVRKARLDVGHSAKYSVRTKSKYFNEKDIVSYNSSNDTGSSLYSIVSNDLWKGKSKFIVMSINGEIVHSDADASTTPAIKQSISTGHCKLAITERTKLRMQFYQSPHTEKAYNYIMPNQVGPTVTTGNQLDYYSGVNESAFDNQMSFSVATSDGTNSYLTRYKTPVSANVGIVPEGILPTYTAATTTGTAPVINVANTQALIPTTTTTGPDTMDSGG